MRRGGFAALILVVSVLFGVATCEAKTWVFEKANVKFDLPDNWKGGTVKQVLIKKVEPPLEADVAALVSPKQRASVMVIMLDVDDVQKAIELALGQVGQSQSVAFAEEFASVALEELGGEFKVFTKTGEGKTQKGKPVYATVWACMGTPTRATVICAVVGEKGKELAANDLSTLSKTLAQAK